MFVNVFVYAIERYAIIFFSRKCRQEGCAEINVEIELVVFGGDIRVYTTCYNGHELTWESTDFFNMVSLMYPDLSHLHSLLTLCCALPLCVI